MIRIVVLTLLALAMPATAFAQIVLQAQVSHVDRRLIDAGPIETQAGITGGGSAGVAWKRIALSLGAAGGTLTSGTPDTPDVEYGRVDAEVGVAITPWVRIATSAAALVYVSPAGAQRWILPRVGVDFRVPFNSIPATAYFGGSAMVGTSTNAAIAATGGVAMRSGIEVRARRTELFVQYAFERLTFSAATRRKEQTGETTLGLRLRR